MRCAPAIENNGQLIWPKVGNAMAVGVAMKVEADIGEFEQKGAKGVLSDQLVSWGFQFKNRKVVHQEDVVVGRDGREHFFQVLFDLLGKIAGRGEKRSS